MKLSVVIIAKNEEAMIGDCLASTRQVADELILIDNGSTDKTVEIAKKYGTRIFKLPTSRPAFSRLRNLGLQKAHGDWILYLDADERVTPALKKEILQIITVTPRMVCECTPPRCCFVAYEIPRRNFYLGQEMRHGGAWPDYVKRLFWRSNLKCWQRELHEDPVFSTKCGSKIGRLKAPFIHLTHRDLSSMIAKTNQWSQIEARLLFDAKHVPVTWWRLLRPMFTEFWQRGIVKKGLLDGPVGWIEVIFQMFSRFMTYARLWELQLKTKDSSEIRGGI